MYDMGVLTTLNLFCYKSINLQTKLCCVTFDIKRSSLVNARRRIDVAAKSLLRQNDSVATLYFYSRSS